METKEKFIKDLNRAFAKADVPFILDCMTEDIEWEMVGGNISRGKAEIEKEMATMKDFETLEMEVDNVITHGKLASATGSFKMKEKDMEKSYKFCDIYEFNGFKNAKIRKMTSFVIPVKSDAKINNDEKSKNNTKPVV